MSNIIFFVFCFLRFLLTNPFGTGAIIGLTLGGIYGLRQDHKSKMKQKDAKKKQEEFNRSWAAFEASQAYRDKEFKKYFSLPLEEQEPILEFLDRVDRQCEQIEEAFKKGQKLR
jgi:hypothetical protein